MSLKRGRLYTGESIFQVRHGESLKSLLCGWWDLNPLPKKPMVCRRRHLLKGISVVLVCLTTCKRLTNSLPKLSPITIRGGGCAIRPAPTQKWAAATYLAVGTTKKEFRRDTTTKNRSHKPQICTTISPGCVILCTPGDKSMVCQKRPKLSPGSCPVGGVISHVRVISCVSYGYYHVPGTVCVVYVLVLVP